LSDGVSFMGVTGCDRCLDVLFDDGVLVLFLIDTRDKQRKAVISVWILGLFIGWLWV
jgi:hypothetical protein